MHFIIQSALLNYSFLFAISQAFQWIFCMRVINRPSKEVFFANSAGDLLHALEFLGGLYNFCNFVIIFSLMLVKMIFRSSILQVWKWSNTTKKRGWNSKSWKTQDYVRNYAKYTKLKIIFDGLCWDIWLLWEYQNKILIQN